MPGKANAFTENDCDLCQKRTYWYQSSGEIAPGHCTNHSNWQKGVKHAVPPIVQGANLAPTKVKQAREGLNEVELRNVNRINKDVWARSVEARRKAHYLPTTAAFASVAATLRESCKESAPADPDAVYCYQCGKQISKVTATSETKPLIKQVIDPAGCHKDENGDPVIAYKTKITAKEVHACKDCCLSIRKPVSVRIV